MDTSKYNRLFFNHHMVTDTGIQDSLVLYLLYGIEPGGGVTALLTNDLYRAAQSIHVKSRDKIADMATWVITCAPHESWGTRESMRLWMNDENGCRSRFAEEAKVALAMAELGEGKYELIHGHIVDTSILHFS